MQLFVLSDPAGRSSGFGDWCAHRPFGAPFRFFYRVLTTRILEFVIGSHSLSLRWTAFQSVAVDLNFGFPLSQDVFLSLSSHSGQHQSQWATATFCSVWSVGAVMRFGLVPRSQHASLLGVFAGAPEWPVFVNVNPSRLTGKNCDSPYLRK